MMPEVDRRKAAIASAAARRERARLKNMLRTAEITALEIMAAAADPQNPAAAMRVREFLLALPAMGNVKVAKTMQELNIAQNKKLGGLGKMQQQRLENYLSKRAAGQARAKITVLSGPTAVGKGTVVKHLLKNCDEVHLSISATTRDPRPGEEHGKDYYFVTDAEFDAMIERDEMLEWALVHGKHRYGTPRGPLTEAVAAGKLVLLEIDLQGAREVKKSEPEAQLVFLLPPSWEELERRLIGRGTESAAEQQRRLETAKTELAAAAEFDEQIVNDEIERAAAALLDTMRG